MSKQEWRALGVLALLSCLGLALLNIGILRSGWTPNYSIIASILIVVLGIVLFVHFWNHKHSWPTDGI